MVCSALGACLDCFKAILACGDFGTEYELLCTELSVQLLRISLWSQSSGSDLSVPDGLRSLVDRPDITPTVSQTIESINFLLTDIEILRRKYQIKPTSTTTHHGFPHDIKAAPARSPLSTHSTRNPARALRRCMRENQHQKSWLAIAKWAVRDSKRFESKVRRLSNLIDGLEDISKAASVSHLLTPTLPNFHDERPPPPYSADTPLLSRNTDLMRPQSYRSPTISEHHSTLLRYLGPLVDPITLTSRTVETLQILSNSQFRELSTDFIDELLRRQNHEMMTSNNTISDGPVSSSLPPDLTLRPKRNEARQRLSTISTPRFRHLASDILLELERRFPYLRDQIQYVPYQTIRFPNPYLPTADPATRRYGCVLPEGYPPPLLQYRAAHPSSFGDLSEWTDDLSPNGYQWPRPSPRLVIQTNDSPPIPPPIGNAAPEGAIFKSFRVAISHPCHRVLLAALKKYNINAPPESYALYVMCGDKERCLGRDERPLEIFQKLVNDGNKPLFMLRKVASRTNAPKEAGDWKLNGGVL